MNRTRRNGALTPTLSHRMGEGESSAVISAIGRRSTVHGPDACAKAKRAFHEPNLGGLACWLISKGGERPALPGKLRSTKGVERIERRLIEVSDQGEIGVSGN